MALQKMHEFNQNTLYISMVFIHDATTPGYWGGGYHIYIYIYTPHLPPNGLNVGSCFSYMDCLGIAVEELVRGCKHRVSRPELCERLETWEEKGADEDLAWLPLGEWGAGCFVVSFFVCAVVLCCLFVGWFGLVWFGLVWFILLELLMEPF